MRRTFPNFIILTGSLLVLMGAGCKPSTKTSRIQPAGNALAAWKMDTAMSVPDSAVAPSNAPSSAAAPSLRTAKTLSNYLGRLAPEPQLFLVDADSTSLVRGDGGTILHINPADLALPDGSAPKAPIVVLLQELASQQDIALAGAQTLAGDQLLESAGAYAIQISSGNQPLTLRDGKALRALFPKPANIAAGMQLFYGQRNELGAMNWTAAGQALDKKDSTAIMTTDRQYYSDVSVMGYGVCTEGTRAWVGRRARYTGDSITKAQVAAIEEAEASVYEAVSLSRLGWINCDRFLNTRPEEITQLACTVEDGTGKNDPVRLFLVFKGINSVLDRWYLPTQQAGQEAFKNIPRGEAVRLVAVSKGKHGLRAAQYNLTTGEAASQVITLQPATDQELKQMFAVR